MLPVDVSSPFGTDRHRRAARQPAPGLILNEKTSTPITVWPRRKRRKCMPYHRPLMIRAASMEQCNARGCRTTIAGVPGVIFATPTDWQDGWCMIWGYFTLSLNNVSRFRPTKKPPRQDLKKDPLGHAFPPGGGFLPETSAQKSA